MDTTIMQIHDRFPGLTEWTIGAARDNENRSSYELLCDLAGNFVGKKVLDLACGNGPLSEIVLRRIGPEGCLFGVDLNASELQLARRRFAGVENARFIQADATSTELPSAAVDVVLCHMAFMLFNPPGPVVSELARILKGGGLFAAVVPALREPAPVFRALMGRLVNALQGECLGEHPALQSMAELKDAASLGRLFSPPHGFTGEIRRENVDVALRGPPAAVVENALAGFYSAHLLPPPLWGRVKDEWREILEDNASPDGMVVLPLPLSAFVVTRMLTER